MLQYSTSRKFQIPYSLPDQVTYYIHICPSCVEAVFSIPNPRLRKAVVTEHCRGLFDKHRAFQISHGIRYDRCIRNNFIW